MKIKMLAGTGLALALLLGWAAPALAHVTTDPSSAPQGGEITLGFRVPNEEASANVVKVDIAFPTDPPLLGVDTEPVPGWTSTVTNTKLNPPVSTDDGPVVQAVSEIVWTASSGGGTPPGSFQEFYVLVQQLPTDSTQVVFKAIQTYSDGSVVSWIDPVTAAVPDPDHPTPILKLTPAGGTTPASPTTSAIGSAPISSGRRQHQRVDTIDVSKLAKKKSSVSSASTLGVIGIIIGALGLLVALIAVHPAGSPTGPPRKPGRNVRDAVNVLASARMPVVKAPAMVGLARDVRLALLLLQPSRRRPTPSRGWGPPTGPRSSPASRPKCPASRSSWSRTAAASR